MSNIKEMLERHEGRANKPYRDTEGIPTIGVGHNLNYGLSDAEVDEIFAEDLTATRDWVQRSIGCFSHLSENRQNVVLDMAFNLRGKLLGFKGFLDALGAGDYGKAADEMLDSAWAKQVKGRATELADMMRAG